MEVKLKRFRQRKNNKQLESQVETKVQVNKVNMSLFLLGKFFLFLMFYSRIYTTSQKKKCIIYKNDSSSSLITNK